MLWGGEKTIKLELYIILPVVVSCILNWPLPPSSETDIAPWLKGWVGVWSWAHPRTSCLLVTWWVPSLVQNPLVLSQDYIHHLAREHALVNQIVHIPQAHPTLGSFVQFAQPWGMHGSRSKGWDQHILFSAQYGSRPCSMSVSRLAYTVNKQYCVQYSTWSPHSWSSRWLKSGQII